MKKLEVFLKTDHYFSGKSLVLKERAIRAKKLSPAVIFISLGSCTPFGHPYEIPIIYDVITGREMISHQITFKHVIHLMQENTNSGNDESQVGGGTSPAENENNLQFAFETVQKVAKKEISHPEMGKILDNHNIDRENAIQFYNSQRNKRTQEHHNMDVYGLLLACVKRNPHLSYYVDELPILLSHKSKLI